MTYEIFTTQLSKLKQMKAEHRRLADRLDELIYIETGVKGVSYGGTLVSHNPSFSAIKRLDMIEKIDELCREINFLAICITQTEEILDRMPNELKQMLTDKYIKGWTFDKVGDKYGYSHSGIQYRMEKETERYL